MVHSFKYGGYRFAYDTVSGTLFRFDELTYKMLDYIGLPMPVDCPSALRYDLAKYDSMAIDDAYDALYALSKEGKIFVPENGAEIVRPSVTDLCSCSRTERRLARKSAYSGERVFSR